MELLFLSSAVSLPLLTESTHVLTHVCLNEVTRDVEHFGSVGRGRLGTCEWA